MKIAGTGTRSLALSPKGMIRARDYLAELLASGLPRHPDLSVICGMSEGFDEAFAQAAIKADVPFHAYVPTESYAEYYWGTHSRTGKYRVDAFYEILEQAASVRYVCESLYVVIGGKRVHANIARNYAMVDDSDKLWAFDPGVIEGGTKRTVDYARSVGKDIFYVREANFGSDLPLSS